MVKTMTIEVGYNTETQEWIVGHSFDVGGVHANGSPPVSSPVPEIMTALRMFASACERQTASDKAARGKVRF